MINLKTKSDKHALDNEKRRKSIKEKEKAKLNQSQIIKQALSNSNLNNSSSKKIVFQNDDDDDIDDRGRDEGSKRVNGKGKPLLFDSSASEDENYEIKEKSQFSGKKGFELLNLQSTYGNDERFKIDERFLDDEKGIDNVEAKEGEDGSNKTDAAEEKVKQLKILESVLGQPVVTPEAEKKPKSRTYEMIRYDATNKDHERFEVKSQPETPISKMKKKKEKKRTDRTDREYSPKPVVSKEKFYEVSSEIKNAFKEKEEGQFSLLQTYGLNDAGGSEEPEEEAEEERGDAMDEDFYRYEHDEEEERDIEMENEPEVVKRDVKVAEKEKTQANVAVAKGIKKESFFFADDDPRFTEGLEFINKKNSEEATAAAENYDQARKKLREILRLHMKKHLHKKDPFKNKVGGIKKKNVANSRFKNSRPGYDKRKPPRMNPPGKI